MLALMGLVAVQGTELVIEVAGPNAAETLQTLVQIFQRNYDEEQ
jgi:phosphotransferase system HPr-like phosphotransfer protein